MTNVDPHDYDDLPESMGCAIMRCPGCGMVHITLLDDDEQPITELTLGDGDVLALAMQLLCAVYPKLNTGKLQAAIKGAPTWKDQHH